MRRSLVTLIALLIIIGAAVGVYALVHDNNDNQNQTPATSTTPTTSSSTENTPSSSSTASKIVQTKTGTNTGQYLADVNDMPLYTYGADTTGVSNCTGSCLTDWPVYTATQSKNLPTNVTVITRSDGSKQYAYKGMPLYTFSSDTAGQEPSGDGVSDFHIAKP